MNLVHFAREAVPTALRCVCGATLYRRGGRLMDGAGQDRCVSGAVHSPVVAPSPTRGWLR